MQSPIPNNVDERRAPAAHQPRPGGRSRSRARHQAAALAAALLLLPSLAVADHEHLRPPPPSAPPDILSRPLNRPPPEPTPLAPGHTPLVPMQAPATASPHEPALDAARSALDARPVALAVAVFVGLVLLLAMVKAAAAIVNAAGELLAWLLSPAAWWRATCRLWDRVTTLRTVSAPPAAEPPWGHVRLPPAVIRRRLRAPVLEERRDRSGEHVLVAGPTRSGKGEVVIVPTLLAGWRHSVICNDPKGDLWRRTAGRRERDGARVFLLDPTSERSHRLNLMLELREGREHLTADAQSLASLLVNFDPEEAAGEDGTWRAAAWDLMVAALIHVRLGPDPSLAKVARLVGSGDVGLKQMRDEARHPLSQRVARRLLGTASGDGSAKAEGYRNSVLNGAATPLAVFADPRVEAATSGPSHFTVSDLMCADRPLAVYLAVPGSDRDRLLPWVRATLGFVQRSLMVREHHDRDGRAKKRRLLMCVDEAPSAGWPGLSAAMQAAASYGISMLIATQSRHELRRRFGPGVASNCGVSVNLKPNLLEEAKELSGMVGRSRFLEPVTSVTRSGGWIMQTNAVTESTRRAELPVLPEEEILAWPARTWALVIGDGGAPWVGAYSPAHALPEYVGLELPAPAVAPLDLLPEEPEPGAEPDDEPENPVTRTPPRRRRRQPGELPTAAE